MFEEFYASKANLYWISTLPFVTITISPGSRSRYLQTDTLYYTAVA